MAEVKSFNILGQIIDVKDVVARKHWLRDKKVVVYGDSTTQIENSYIKKLSDFGAIVTNRGVSGTAIIHDNNSTGAIDLIPNAADLNNFDYIFMCYGANELGGWHYNYPGAAGMQGSTNDINYCLNAIFTFLMNKKCVPVFVLPPIVHQESWGTSQANGYTGSTQDAFNDMVIGYCEKYNIEYFNLFTLCPVNHLNYTKYYLNDNSNGIWIHPNDLLNTIIFNQIISRNSNNGRCYPGKWFDCSNAITSPTTIRAFSPNVLNTPKTLLDDALFFKSYEQTSKFSVISANGGKVRVRVSGICAVEGDTFNQQQIALTDSAGAQSRLCLFSRQKTRTSVTFEVDAGDYTLAFYNTGEITSAWIDFKIECQNGYIVPYDYVLSAVDGKATDVNLTVNFCRDGMHLKGTGFILGESANAVYQTKLLQSDAQFHQDLATMIAIWFDNKVFPLYWSTNGIYASAALTNEARMNPISEVVPYGNLFSIT